ncbi:uncharacterized protein [Pyrus communis]|uniref:uncharacterized protein n=1 Tax=Pyrus communis TaxID=23211 RepID=UPI0035C0CED6
MIDKRIFAGNKYWSFELLKVLRGNEADVRELDLAENFTSQPIRWRRPIFGVLKINFDRAWCGKTGKGGYGWVLRDFAGMLIAAGGVGGLLFSSAAMAEAAAIRAAVQICIEMGCQNVGVESDSLMLIRMINKEYAIDATLERFIYDIGLLVTQLRSVRFMFVKRNGNAAAHTFASYVASHGGAFRWDVLGPEFLFNILVEDVNISIRI